MTLLASLTPGESIHFSIIIPVYNRPSELRECLNAIRRLEYPRDHFEVLVVDDGSCNSLDPAHCEIPRDLNIHLLRQNHAGPAAARNQGASHAIGKYLAFLDVDCRPESDWLIQLEKAFAVDPNAALAGKILNGSPNNLLSLASHLVLDCSFEYYNRDVSEVSFLGSGNFAVPAALFHEVGGFNQSFFAAEDREFCDWWRQRGFHIIFVRNARALHVHSISIRGFLLRHFHYGQGAFFYHRLRAKRKRLSMQLAPIGFYLQLIYRPLQSVPFWEIPVMALLIILSQLSSLVGFLLEGAISKPVEMIARPKESTV